MTDMSSAADLTPQQLALRKNHSGPPPTLRRHGHARHDADSHAPEHALDNKEEIALASLLGASNSVQRSGAMASDGSDRTRSHNAVDRLLAA